jgi:Holliday junction resolvase RusA-like endonuclease
MNRLKVFIPCLPPKTTAQQKGNKVLPGGRVLYFKKDRTKKAEDTLIALLTPHRPQKPFTGALFVSVQWIWPYRTSEPKKNRGGLIHCVTWPDLDNLNKMFCDVLQTLHFFENDSQINRLALSKYYGPTPGIDLEIIADNSQ